MSSGKQIDMLENMYIRLYLNPRGDSIHVDVHAIQCPSAYLQHARYRVTACPLLIQHTRRTFVATMSAHTSSVTVPSSCAEYCINHEPKLVSYRIELLPFTHLGQRAQIVPSHRPMSLQCADATQFVNSEDVSTSALTLRAHCSITARSTSPNSRVWYKSNSSCLRNELQRRYK